MSSEVANSENPDKASGGNARPLQSSEASEEHPDQDGRSYANAAGKDLLSRRVTIGGGMAERRNSFGLPFEHGEVFSRRPSVLGDMDCFGSGMRRDSLDSITAVLDGAILNWTGRRFSMTGGQSTSGGGAPGPVNNWDNQQAPYDVSVNLAARQRQLQHQQRELEQRQKELEIQRQQLIAGMQERARAANMLAAQHHSHDGVSMISSHRQWWVCQICNSKAFASQEEAMCHEATCCVEPVRYEGLATPIPSDHNMHMQASVGRSFSLGLGGPVLDQNIETQPSPSSPGSYINMKEPIPLAMHADKDWLTPLHCFVRRHCVEVFTASDDDVSTPSKGKRKPIHVGQVGIRCPHCHSVGDSGNQRERGSVYYPTSISSIYNATMNLLQRHLHICSAVPADIMRRYETLKGDDARSGTSKRYWIESSKSLGLVDTASGIRFSTLDRPSLPTLSLQQHATGQDSQERRNSNDFFSSDSNAVIETNRGETSGLETPPTSVAKEDHETIGQHPSEDAPLVTTEDEPQATGFSYQLMRQMQPCVFTEADRLGKRKGLPPGFPGLACRHCFGGYGSGRFFPSSIKTLSDTSKTLNVLHNHMMRCRKCPQEVRDMLVKLRATHDDERSKMRFGSQKAFFGKIWERLHKKSPALPAKGKLSGSHRQVISMEQPMRQYPSPFPGPTQAHPHFHMDYRAAHAGLPRSNMLLQHNSSSGPNAGVAVDVSRKAKRQRSNSGAAASFH